MTSGVNPLVVGNYTALAISRALYTKRDGTPLTEEGASVHAADLTVRLVDTFFRPLSSAFTGSGTFGGRVPVAQHAT